MQVDAPDGGIASRWRCALRTAGNAERGSLSLSTPFRNPAGQANWALPGDVTAGPRGGACAAYPDLDGPDPRAADGGSVAGRRCFDWLAGRFWLGRPGHAGTAPGHTRIPLAAAAGWSTWTRAGDGLIVARLP